MDFWIIYIYFGIVFVQTIFITYQLIIFGRKEFVYYLLYTISISVFLIFQAAPQFNPLKSTIAEPEKFTLNRGVWFYVVAFYFRFGRNFCNMPDLYPKHNYILMRLEAVMFVIGGVDIITSYFYGHYYLPDSIVKYVIIAICIFSFYLIGFLGSKKILLNRILVTGSFCVLFFGTISLIDMIVTNYSKSGMRYMQYHVIGITLEFVCLNYGLMLKSKMIEKEKNRLELEKQLAVLRERERIIADLHDDVGGGLSSIRIMSDLLTEKKDRLENPEKFTQKISDTAKDISQKMNTLIWALNSENDTLQNFAEYVRQYAVQYFEGTGINVAYRLLDEAAAGGIVLNGNHRKELFLCIKEILNNALKYSKASEVKIEISLREHNILFISIADNGIGLLHTNQFGNGLKNLKKRITLMEGAISITGDTGTKINMSVPVS
ncbi:MAG: ATP-binding protein [Ferruginibacter sp.]